MADYYTNFSLVLKLPTEAAQAYALEIHHQAERAHQGDELAKNFPKELESELEDWQFEIDADDPAEEHGLWLHSMNGGMDAVCAFIQHLLQKFDSEAQTRKQL